MIGSAICADDHLKGRVCPSTKIPANSFRKDNLSNNKLTLDNLRLRQPGYDVGSHVTASIVCP